MDVNLEILNLYKKDEKAGFRMLFDQYYYSLLLFSNSIVKDNYVAEDVVQECFVLLWTNKRLRSFSGSLDQFLFRMIKNLSINHIREAEKKKRVNLENDLEDYPSMEDAGFDELYLVINRLPSKCREIFLKACLENKKYHELAEEFDISINTVKSHMKYALRFLRENLIDYKNSLLLIFLTKINNESSHPKI